ncbi:cell division protein FtsL [Vagococcus elongatus]|uniref:Cell division protein FtsL n=1 Tax=Vagococcus elongatus TaxID=180344 RepID=A0A430AYD4_9ENTE|nr:cell division protein FtsL [Vagococcus elongatus]RSU13054.1 cell division protein FtsL [Vagococcus elongatus]
MAEPNRVDYYENHYSNDRKETTEEVVIYQQPVSRLRKISKMEKVVFGILVLFLLGVSGLTIQLSNRIAQQEQNIATIQEEKENLRGDVRELEQEKGELSRPERLKNAAEKEGLEKNEENIRNVTE